MSKKKLIKMTASALTIGTLLTANIPNNVLAEDTSKIVGITDVKSILANLTKEQRIALKTLDAGPGFVVSPELDLNTPSEVKVIVEFEQAPAKVEVLKQSAEGKRLSLSAAKQKVEESHEAFEANLQQLQKKKDGVKNFQAAKITREYKDAFNGVAMTLPGNTIEELLQSGVVKRVWKDYEIKLDLPKESTQETAQVGIKPQMADSVPQIGVDKLHSENITGRGIKVGVLDTGIDYNHPDLQDAYKGYRAQEGEDPKTIDDTSVKGWDFIDNDADPMETTYQDWKKAESEGWPEVYNGTTYYTSHGTHVAGTIAGDKKNNVDYAVNGVAPDVDLYAYRVLGKYGSGTTSGVLAGIDKAVKDGMQVINMSLGAATSDPLYATSVAANNAMLAGVVTVVAAGNAGSGASTVGSPGASALAITVGASDSAIKIPTFTADAGDLHIDTMKLLGKNFTDKLEDLKGQALTVEYAGLGYADDFAGKDFNGKLALIQRGTISFDEKIKNAVNAGAKGVIVYNNVDGEIPAYLGEDKSYIPAFALTKNVGEQLKEKVDKGDVTLTFGELGNVKTEGDHLADFSSRGPIPLNDDIKPDIVAPGVSIFSTVPEYINDPQDGDHYDIAYKRMSGTSMATPHTAGVAALILQEHQDYNPFDVKAALMNTADDLKEERSVYEMGAGRIDAYQAVHADTSIKVIDKTQNIQDGKVVEIEDQTGSIAFGGEITSLDNEPVTDSRKVRIQNHSETETKEFKLEIEYSEASKWAKDAIENGVKLKVPSSFVVDPNASGEIDPEIFIPANAEYGRYEGYIDITNKNNEQETYQIPFSVRYSERGIAYVDLIRDVMATDTSQFHQYMAGPFSPFTFKLNSPLQIIDVIVKDTKTGKPVGYVGTIDGTRIATGVDYSVLIGMPSAVFPFTGNPAHPIADSPKKLPEGDFTMEFIAYDEEGTSYTKGDSIIVDNTPPKITFNDLQPGIHEVSESMFTEEDGQRAVWVHGNIYDSTIDALKAKGVATNPFTGRPYDQRDNTIVYYQNSPWPTGTLQTIQPNGEFKFGVAPEELGTPLNLKMYGYDAGTAANSAAQMKQYIFVKEGTEYGAMSYNVDTVELKDKFIVTLSLNNVKQLLSGEFAIPYLKENFEFMDVQPNASLIKYAEQNGLNVQLLTPAITETLWEKTVKVGASLEGTKFKGLDGDMPFLDVTFQVINDEYFQEVVKFQNTAKFTYTKAGSAETTTIPIYQANHMNFISKHSTIYGYVKPEAFYPPGQNYLPKMDYIATGVKVYAVDPNGKKYKGTINNSGQYEIHNVPVIDEAYDIVVDAPGHLKTINTQIVGNVRDGKLVGANFSGNYIKSLAGDVNGDAMIDIKDAIEAAAHYGKENEGSQKSDLNQDGKVDEKDVRFIEKNFLKKGPDAKPEQNPVENIGPKTLEKILRSIGLEPKN
jgi:subtilisin family serine protease